MKTQAVGIYNFMRIFFLNIISSIDHSKIAKNCHDTSNFLFFFVVYIFKIILWTWFILYQMKGWFQELP